MSVRSKAIQEFGHTFGTHLYNFNQNSPTCNFREKIWFLVFVALRTHAEYVSRNGKKNIQHKHKRKSSPVGNDLIK